MSQRILVVEDDESLLFALREYLSSLGYEVDGARECEEAEALLNHFEYSLVIADLALTRVGFEGFEVVRSSLDRCSRPRVMVWTGHIEPELESEARGRGADVFLQKPVALQEVARIVADLLEARV